MCTSSCRGFILQMAMATLNFIIVSAFLSKWIPYVFDHILNGNVIPGVAIATLCAISLVIEYNLFFSLFFYLKSGNKKNGQQWKSLKRWRKLTIYCIFLENMALIVAGMSEPLGRTPIFNYLTWVAYKVLSILAVSLYMRRLKRSVHHDPEITSSEDLTQDDNPPPSYSSIFPVETHLTEAIVMS
ncbi:unnamed protein product [Orchesella dallaii]|uniref:Transmembrane protein n=1 Tax=Orchesella dallaii TaxID=48710 RepID=A0ABP1PZL3_9HEXA